MSPWEFVLKRKIQCLVVLCLCVISLILSGLFLAFQTESMNRTLPFDYVLSEWTVRIPFLSFESFVYIPSFKSPSTLRRPIPSLVAVQSKPAVVSFRITGRAVNQTSQDTIPGQNSWSSEVSLEGEKPVIVGPAQLLNSRYAFISCFFSFVGWKISSSGTALSLFDIG